MPDPPEFEFEPLPKPPPPPAPPPEVTADVDLDRYPRCPECGYSLYGLPGRVCPECGRLIRSGEITTFPRPLRGDPRRQRLLAWLGAAMVLAGVVLSVRAAVRVAMIACFLGPLAGITIAVLLRRAAMEEEWHRELLALGSIWLLIGAVLTLM